jgi:hypothetical protein
MSDVRWRAYPEFETESRVPELLMQTNDLRLCGPILYWA